MKGHIKYTNKDELIAYAFSVAHEVMKVWNFLVILKQFLVRIPESG